MSNRGVPMQKAASVGRTRDLRDRQHDVSVAGGRVLIVFDNRKGWVIPGGEIVKTKRVAKQVANLIAYKFFPLPGVR